MPVTGRTWSAVAAMAAAMTSVSVVQADVLDIKTLSTRSDRVSGGDVLVEITQSDDAAMPVTLNGVDVSKAFKAGAAPHTRAGLVSGLKLGANTVAAGGKTLAVTNYPITGPIVSGPHQTPFICTTANFKIFMGRGTMQINDDTTFGPSLDKACTAATKISYLYLPKGGKVLQPVKSVADIPADVAMTTTTTGATVKFIVRYETSTIDRGIFQSAILYDPADPAPTPTAPPKGWNRRLIVIQGAGCAGGWYHQGTAGGSNIQDTMDASLLSVDRLGEGYGLYGNTLQNASQSCNAVLSGEAAMMGKEHFIETYGVPVYTVSLGCSGGSYGSAQPADAIPGLYDGVLISCTFPDPLAIAMSGSDGHLLTHYFTKMAPGKLTEAQQVAISGYKGIKAFIDAANQSQRTDPVPARADIEGYNSAVWNPVVPAELRYDPVKNPRGARPTVYDASRNMYGVDPKTGFALRVFDNVGVQYGLAALEAGLITPAQFLDLNERIGGTDNDANYIAARTVGDEVAIKRAYQSGLQLGGNGGLADIPIVDTTGNFNDDSGYHYQWFHFAMRERLAQANGNTDNHVMWRGKPVPFNKSWAMFISWMENVAKDTSSRPARQKAIAAKPANAVDGCWTSQTDFTNEKQVFGHDGTACNTALPSYAFPRYVAGGPLAANILKCQLKPMAAGDYKAAFKPEEMARLKRIFPGGVCDFAQRGVGQTGVVTYASFGPAPENLVYDITREQ
ncbi:MAG: hypothetical protein EXQ84_05980 [Rhodospirillaceae bacterium]|nr:hypothetical protein [Rhodospirillaceae bacterium]